jgi:hypothetical protein
MKIWEFLGETGEKIEQQARDLRIKLDAISDEEAYRVFVSQVDITLLRKKLDNIVEEIQFLDLLLTDFLVVGDRELTEEEIKAGKALEEECRPLPRMPLSSTQVKVKIKND